MKKELEEYTPIAAVQIDEYGKLEKDFFHNVEVSRNRTGSYTLTVYTDVLNIGGRVTHNSGGAIPDRFVQIEMQAAKQTEKTFVIAGKYFDTQQPADVSFNFIAFDLDTELPQPL